MPYAVRFSDDGFAMTRDERQMYAEGCRRVQASPLKVFRHPAFSDVTFFLVFSPKDRSEGWYVLLPDRVPYLDPLAERAMARIDLLNAMQSLEYVAGGGEL